MLYQVAYRCDDERRSLLEGVVSGLAAGNTFKVQEGVWLIETNGPATEVRDRIKQHLNGRGTVIVSLLAGHAAWHGFDREATDWLLAYL